MLLEYVRDLFVVSFGTYWENNFQHSEEILDFQQTSILEVLTTTIKNVHIAERETHRKDKLRYIPNKKNVQKNNNFTLVCSTNSIVDS